MPRSARRARSDVMHRSPMGERRGWKLFGINIGAPSVPKGTFTDPNANPVTQQAIDEGANQVNQNIAAGNKRSLEGMAAVGGIGALGAAGAAGAGGMQGATGDTPFTGNMNPGDVSDEGDPYDPSTAMLPGSEYPGGQVPGDTSDGGFGNWLKGEASKAGSALFGSGGPGQSSLFDKLLLGGAVASSAADSAYKKGLINQGVKSATDAYNAAAPLRTQGMAAMQNRSGPDLSSIFEDPGDPYARSAPPVNLTNTGPSGGPPPVPGTIAGQVGQGVRKALGTPTPA